MVEFKSEMIFLFVLKLSLKCAEIYLPVTIKASTSSDIQELWILQNQMEKKIARAGVQFLLVLLNQDFRPGHIVLKIALLRTDGLEVCGSISDWIRA